MNEKIKLKVKEAFSSVFPISIIILILSFTLVPLSSGTIATFFISTILLIVGMGIFTLGSEIAMSVIGERIGASIVKSKNILFIFIILFTLGTIITIAEPDLKVLASQIPTIPEYTTILAVSIGVGIFLVIAFLRIIFKINLTTLLFISYMVVFILAQFVPPEFLAISFDSGGVTTGPITVPFIIALGIGAASIREHKESENDNFGLVALCSVGPIIAVLLLGILFNVQDASYSMYEITNFQSSTEIMLDFINSIPKYLEELSLAILPILIFFLIYQVTALKLPFKKVCKILTGILYTYLGLVMFLLAVNKGFLPVGYLIGTHIASLEFNWIAIPIGMIIGYFIVIAEPAVVILINQIADVTDGAIPEKAMKFNLSISISLAVGLAVVRIFTGISILYLMIPGYIIALSLSLVTPKVFTAIAFDSGGVATGPITTTFLIPFSIGLCTSLGGNVLTDAFGVVAMIAMMPLISVQISGLIFKFKTINKKNCIKENDNEIINMDWEWENCLN